MVTTTDEEAWPNCPDCDEEMRPGGEPTPGSPRLTEVGTAEVPLDFGFICENKECPSYESDLAKAAEQQPPNLPRMQQSDEASGPRDE